MTPWQLGLDWFAQKTQTLVQARRWHWLILLVWMVPPLLAGFFDLDSQSLMAHDEGLYARRARVIVDSGDWVHPWAAPHHKTPGPYWVVAVFIQLFGRHEVAVRLPSVLACMGCVWLTYAIGRRLLDPTAALLGTLSLGVAPLWLQYSRLATPDVIFTGLILLTVWLLLEADTRDQYVWICLGAGIALGLTVLLRSALAIVPMVCLLPYLLLSKRKHLKQWSFYLGGGIGLLPTVIWVWLCWRRYDMAVIDALINFPVNQSLTAERAKSPLFYLFNLLVNDFLWIFFALVAVGLLLRHLIRSKGRNLSQQPQISLLVLYPLLYLGGLSFASTKLPHYAIPTYPFLALLTGYAMARLTQATPGLALKWLMMGLNRLLLLGGILLTVAATAALGTNWLPSTDEIRPYAPIALGLGLFWLMAGLWWIQPEGRRRPTSWLLLLLLGHWVSLTLAWGTAELGNVNPEMKALLIRQDMQSILQMQAVDFSPGLDSKRSTLLRFYTPNPGRMLTTLDQLEPGDYVWIESPELTALARSHKSLGQIEQTHLVHIYVQ